MWWPYIFCWCNGEWRRCDGAPHSAARNALIIRRCDWRFIFTLSTIAASISLGVLQVACPFFVPTVRFDDGGWIHPSRLPLGAGWKGHCSAPDHEGAEPTDDQLRELCNLGYASVCPRLPKERACDAVRLGIAHDRSGQLALWFVCESAHRPGEHGTLEYDLSSQQWTSSHSDTRIQKMANCYLKTYLLRRNQPAPAELQVTQSND